MAQIVARAEGCGASPADDAMLACALFALDPSWAGGVVLRASPGAVRDYWLARARELAPRAAPWRRVPVHVTDGRLLGGLDLAATLRAGRRIVERGVLADADGGVVVLAMAERLEPGTVARIVAVLDRGEVALERDGVGVRLGTSFGAIALDEGLAADERPAAALRDRLAIHLELDGLSLGDLQAAPSFRNGVAEARARLPGVGASAAAQTALCAAAMSLGVESLRPVVLALRVARAAAALHGHDEVGETDAAIAARLVLAPRATRLPQALSAESQGEQRSRAQAQDPDCGDDPRPDHDRDARALDDVVLEAALASIPPDALAALRPAPSGRGRAGGSGRSGVCRRSPTHGRPSGVRAGEPRVDGRLNVPATLRAAAPWQRLRADPRAPQCAAERPGARIAVRREDYRVTRFKRREASTAIFVVDASGSSAMHRLAEAKGAVELLLAQCYVRRDRVALVAFRGQSAEVLLAPTRSLVRARRSLAALPGGGGTPLAAGIDQAAMLADSVRRRGETPLIVLMTDARANVARDGAADPQRAEEEALQAAGALRRNGFAALLIDTSPRPRPVGERFAAAMGARYLPLPYADSVALSQVVGAARGERTADVPQLRGST